MSSDYAIIILAAGESKRLGKPKQLVKYKGETLLNRSIKTAKIIQNTDVYVILGSQHEKVFLSMPKVNCYVNANWRNGMSNTISFAVQAMALKKYKGLVLMTCDQPFLRVGILKNILRKFEQGEKEIIISKYKNGQGIPSFFSKKYFKDLIKLEGDDGAKDIVRKNIKDVGFINFENGDKDIDTSQDVRNVLKH